jgi:hypothetical protein
MKEKTKKSLLGIAVTAGLTLLCGLAYAINKKLGQIAEIGDLKYDEEEE